MSREVYDWIGVRPGDIYQSSAGVIFYSDGSGLLHVIDIMGQVVDPPEREQDLFPAVRVAKNPASRKVGKTWKNLTGDWACVPAEIKAGDIYLSNVSTRLLWLDAWGRHWTLDEDGVAHAAALTHPFPAQHLVGQNRDATAIKQPRRPKFSAGDKVQEVFPPHLVVDRLASEPTQAGDKHTYIVLLGNGVEKEFKEDELISWKGSL